MGIKAAEFIKKYRLDCSINQTQLAKILKTSQGIISDIENGGSISKKLAKKFSVLLEQPLEIFLG